MKWGQGREGLWKGLKALEGGLPSAPLLPAPVPWLKVPVCGSAEAWHLPGSAGMFWLPLAWGDGWGQGLCCLAGLVPRAGSTSELLSGPLCPAPGASAGLPGLFQAGVGGSPLLSALRALGWPGSRTGSSEGGEAQI